MPWGDAAGGATLCGTSWPLPPPSLCGRPVPGVLEAPHGLYWKLVRGGLAGRGACGKGPGLRSPCLPVRRIAVVQSGTGVAPPPLGLMRPLWAQGLSPHCSPAGQRREPHSTAQETEPQKDGKWRVRVHTAGKGGVSAGGWGPPGHQGRGNHQHPILVERGIQSSEGGRAPPAPEASRLAVPEGPGRAHGIWECDPGAEMTHPLPLASE